MFILSVFNNEHGIHKSVIVRLAKPPERPKLSHYNDLFLVSDDEGKTVRQQPQHHRSRRDASIGEALLDSLQDVATNILTPRRLPRQTDTCWKRMDANCSGHTVTSARCVAVHTNRFLVASFAPSRLIHELINNLEHYDE